MFTGAFQHEGRTSLAHTVSTERAKSVEMREENHTFLAPVHKQRFALSEANHKFTHYQKLLNRL